MTRFRRFAAIPLLVVLCLVVSLLTTRVAGLSVVPRSPAVVGVLNLDLLLQGLERRQGLQEQFDQKREAIRASLQQKLDVLNRAKDELAALEGTPDYEQRRIEVRKMEAMLSAEEAYEANKLAMEDARAVQELYLQITTELKTFCETNEIDLVLLDSSPASEFPRTEDGRILNNQQTMQAIASWETMYVNPQIDITADFIAYMNR